MSAASREAFSEFFSNDYAVLSDEDKSELNQWIDSQREEYEQSEPQDEY